MQWTHNPLAVGSNPTGPSSQAPENKRVKEISEQSQKSEGQNLAEILFSKKEIDADLRLLIERWPILPEHIKAAVKALVKTVIDTTEGR